MTGAEAYRIEATPEFARDVLVLRAAAKADPARHLHLYREVLRVIDQLREGLTNGHHALGYASGKGDLRDCVTAYVQADPRGRAGHRLVFREIGPQEPNGLPRRELLAVKARQGVGNVYEHACARLRRHPADRQPGLNRFGDRAAGEGGRQAERQAELDAKRAIAQAWAGQRPLASSRPLRGTPRGTPRRTRAPVPGPAVGRSVGSPSGTGWPERAR